MVTPGYCNSKKRLLYPSPALDVEMISRSVGLSACLVKTSVSALDILYLN